MTLPIHYDDYDLFLSPLSDFKAEIDRWAEEESSRRAEEVSQGGGEEGVSERAAEVIYWERGHAFQFDV